MWYKRKNKILYDTEDLNLSVYERKTDILEGSDAPGGHLASTIKAVVTVRATARRKL